MDAMPRQEVKVNVNGKVKEKKKMRSLLPLSLSRSRFPKKTTSALCRGEGFSNPAIRWEAG